MIQVKTVFFKAKSPRLSRGGLVEANLGVFIEAIVAQAADRGTRKHSQISDKTKMQ